MKLNDLYHIWNCFNACSDFISSNGDGDESGLIKEMMGDIQKSESILDNEIKKIQLRNALKRVKRQRNK